MVSSHKHTQMFVGTDHVASQFDDVSFISILAMLLNEDTSASDEPKQTMLHSLFMKKFTYPVYVCHILIPFGT